MSHHITAKQRGQANENHIQKELEKPERAAAKAQFRFAHENDTDEQLYALLKEMKRREGANLKPIRTIGLSYFEARLGKWSDVMSRINQELAEELALAGGVEPEEWALLRTLRELRDGQISVTLKKGRIIHTEIQE